MDDIFCSVITEDRKSCHQRPISPSIHLPAHLPSSPRIKVKSSQLLARIFDILLRLHAHVEDGAILARANDLVVQTALAPLTLRPQPAETNLELADSGQGLGVQFPRAWSAVGADGAGHFFLADEGFLAAHARLRLLGELHEAA